MNQFKRKPFALIILDGWGLNSRTEGNAIRLAKTPVLNAIYRKYPSCELFASGKSVGLPPGQAGNSEAGHMNIGAGRIVSQESVRINQSIQDETFFRNPAFLQAIQHVRKNKSKIHIMGLLSNSQSGHAYPLHLYSLISLFCKEKLQSVCLHLFTDGRDSPPYYGLKLADKLEKHLCNGEKIATIIGRSFAMERNKRWDITRLAYEALVLGKGLQAKSAHDAIFDAYGRGESDEFVQPTVIGNYKHSRVQDGDAIIFFNLRSDRARQLTKAFIQKQFTKKNPGSFIRRKALKDLLFVAMTDFGPDLGLAITAFPSQNIHGTLPMALSRQKQLYIAESEKYAHITYFLNGGYPDPIAGENRVMIPSPSVLKYDEMPEMSAFLITQVVKQDLKYHLYDAYIINFANADMVAHTGNLKATIKGVSTIDKCLGIITKEVISRGGKCVICADHGNADIMVTAKTNAIDTEHSMNPVPFIIVGDGFSKRTRLRSGGILANVAPTFLDIMNVEPTREMTARSLLF